MHIIKINAKIKTRTDNIKINTNSKYIKKKPIIVH